MNRHGAAGCGWAAAFATACLAAAARAQTAAPADWPSWRGPASSGVSDSGCEWVGTLDAARQVWVSDPVGLSGCGHGSPDHLATGFCDPVIVGNRVFLYWFERSGTNTVEWERIAHSRSFGMRRVSTSYGDPHEAAEQAKFSADDVFVCLDARTGKTLWKRKFVERGFNHRKVYSPVCTPCVSDGRLYGLGSAGRVYCMEAATGKPVWESDVGRAAQHFEQMRALCRETRVRGYEPCGFNHAVLVVDGVVVVGDGGSPLEGGSGAKAGDAGLAGFDARTGEALWRVPACLHRWGMPAAWRHQGTDTILAAGVDRMVAAEPRTGRLLWQVRCERDSVGRLLRGVSDAVALAVSGDVAVVNTSVGKSEGGSVPSAYRLTLSGAQRLWELTGPGMGICHVGAVILGNHAYVSAKSGLACVELETGKVLGTVAGFGHAYSGYAGGDGHLVDGQLTVVRAWPDFRKLEGKLPGAWRAGYIQAPAVAGGRVYIRGREHVYCYDMRKDRSDDAGGAEAIASPPFELDAANDEPARLVALAETAAWPARGAAIERLGALREKARPVAAKLEALLTAAAAKADWGDTDLLIEALLAIEPARVRTVAPELAKRLQSDDPLSVRLGCHALALIGPDAADAVPALVGLLGDRKNRAAPLAARALGRIGPGAAPAVPALLDCLPVERPVETHETALAAKFDGYARLDTREVRALLDADKAFSVKDYLVAKTRYEAFRKEFPESAAASYASDRIGRCEALLRAAAEAAYDGPGDPTPDALGYHAMNALFMIGKTPPDRWPRLMDLAMQHPWVGRSHGLESDVLPRYNSYGVLLLTRLGPSAVPLLLAEARRLADAGRFAAVADVVQAACLLDPAAKKRGLEAIAYAIGPKPGGRVPYMGGDSGQKLTYVQRDLEGTFDMTDPRGIIKSRKEAAEKEAREKEEIPKVDDVIPDP